MYGASQVETVHILLAAAETTPMELHGCAGLDALSISESLVALRVENAAEGRTDLHLPRDLAPSAQEFVAKVMRFPARTGRDPTLRDIWAALSQEQGLVSRVFDHLGIDSADLYRQVSGD